MRAISSLLCGSFSTSHRVLCRQISEKKDQVPGMIFTFSEYFAKLRTLWLCFALERTK